MNKCKFKQVLYDSNQNKIATDYNENYESLFQKNFELGIQTSHIKPIKNSFAQNNRLKKRQQDNRHESICLMNFEILEIFEIMCCTSLNKCQNVSVYSGEAISNLAQLMVEYLLTQYIDYQWPDVDSIKVYIERYN